MLIVPLSGVLYVNATPEVAAGETLPLAPTVRYPSSVTFNFWLAYVAGVVTFTVSIPSGAYTVTAYLPIVA